VATRRGGSTIDMDDDTTDGLPVDQDAALRGGGEAQQPGPFAAYRPGRHRQWDVLFAIAVGGGLGNAGRYLIGEALPTRPGHFRGALF